MKAAIVLAACSVAWVAAGTLFYGSGGLNLAGLVPSLGCVVALWGTIKSDTSMMWFGTAIVAISSVAFSYSVGLLVAPAAVALMLGSLLLSRHTQAGQT